jgi:hypothetical protein
MGSAKKKRELAFNAGVLTLWEIRLFFFFCMPMSGTDRPIVIIVQFFFFFFACLCVCLLALPDVPLIIRRPFKEADLNATIQQFLTGFFTRLFLVLFGRSSWSFVFWLLFKGDSGSENLECQSRKKDS